MKRMSAFLLIIAGLSSNGFSNDAWATDFSGDKGNGGDMCENRFKIVRDDIQKWILAEGSAGLQLPNGVSYGQYNRGMLQQIQNAKISCTDEQIFVGVAEKTCKNFTAYDGSILINCNSNRFMSTSETNQYVLVHHEYAGLSGFEVNTGESSDYQISNQITEFLENQVVKKLAVKTRVDSGSKFDNGNPCRKEEFINQLAIVESSAIYQSAIVALEKNSIRVSKEDPKVTLYSAIAYISEPVKSNIQVIIEGKLIDGTKIFAGIIDSGKVYSGIGFTVDGMYNREKNLVGCKAESDPYDSSKKTVSFFNASPNASKEPLVTVEIPSSNIKLP